MPIAAPTTAEINNSQGFRRVPVATPKFTRFKGSAPKVRPNPYTGLPVKKRGFVLGNQG